MARRLFAETSRALEKATADAQEEAGRHKAASEKATQTVIKLREEANKHKEVLTKHAAAKQKTDEELAKVCRALPTSSGT